MDFDSFDELIHNFKLEALSYKHNIEVASTKKEKERLSSIVKILNNVVFTLEHSNFARAQWFMPDNYYLDELEFEIKEASSRLYDISVATEQHRKELNDRLETLKVNLNATKNTVSD